MKIKGIMWRTYSEEPSLQGFRDNVLSTIMEDVRIHGIVRRASIDYYSSNSFFADAGNDYLIVKIREKTSYEKFHLLYYLVRKKDCAERFSKIIEKDARGEDPFNLPILVYSEKSSVETPEEEIYYIQGALQKAIAALNTQARLTENIIALLYNNQERLK